ncbi:unnamed protein product [Rangifer tarandus platyrhynchus]|uniref:Uncharacterized protein n=2 Tax=Rangifer tarandus platyrhynchus TaxID=3082113 RepID=A0ABN8YYK1_RANTA|nr:unnamed protein product [Rangifer tarandus platyrhynchus]CAI9702367.1 unnamed protein product [Rangifer tarandus platyrhynchus]
MLLKRNSRPGPQESGSSEELHKDPNRAPPHQNPRGWCLREKGLKKQQKCSGFKQQAVLPDTAPEGQETGRSLTGWLWPRVSHEAGIPTSAGLQSPLVLDEAGAPTSNSLTRLLGRGLGSSLADN